MINICEFIRLYSDKLSIGITNLLRPERYISMDTIQLNPLESKLCIIEIIILDLLVIFVIRFYSLFVFVSRYNYINRQMLFDKIYDTPLI